MTSVKIAPRAPFPFENGPSIPCDDSFSSYLTLIKDNFPLELTNSNPERLSCQISIGSRRKAQAGELGVFSAEKYFNGDMDQQVDQIPDTTTINSTATNSRQQSKKEPRTNGTKAKPIMGTASSETSIGNSQSTLLRDHHRSLNESQREANAKKFLGIFRCSCSNKSAVKVDNRDYRSDTSNIKITTSHGPIAPKPSSWQGDDLNLRDMSIERLSLGLKGDAFPFPQNFNQSIDPKSTSVKIFNEFDNNNHKTSTETPNKQKSSHLYHSPADTGVVDGARDDEDAGSESSSDLFEIESISTTSHPFFQRDGAPATPTPGYEPSEASIEWSVVTASAANFPLASEASDDHNQSRATKSTRTQRSAFLLGCASDKAVSVATATAGGRGPSPVSRYKAESCGVVYLSDSGAGDAAAGRALPPGARLHYGEL